VSPQAAEGRSENPTFAPEELLFRRVPYSHIEDGEVNALAIASETKFDPDPKKCTSVLRSAYTESFLDALRTDCAAGKDLSKTHTVMHVTVSDLPKGLEIDPPQKGHVRRPQSPAALLRALHDLLLQRERTWQSCAATSIGTEAIQRMVRGGIEAK
jgi:hypothetical protein